MWNGVIYYEVIGGSDVDTLGSCSSILEVDRSNAGTSNKNFGIMFNIKNKSGEEISIQGLSFYTDITKNVKYTIYTRLYGYEYGMDSLDMWTKIAQGTVKGKGEFSPIVISGDDFDAVDISASNTQGFFITLDSKGLLYRTTSLDPGSTYVRNDDIIVSVGVGVGEPSPPLGNTFYDSRGLHGRVLYGAKNACRVDTKTTLNFVVYHPKNWVSGKLLDTMASSLKRVIFEVLETDEEIIEHVDSLEMIDVEVMNDSSASSPCEAPSASLACAQVLAHANVNHSKGLESGTITYALLQNRERITLGLNAGDIEVYYVGDEPLNSKFIMTLSGVPLKRMGMKEISYFSKQTKEFLLENAESDVFDILSVEVEGQALAFESSEGDESEVKFEGNRMLVDKTTSIDLTTIVTGKHRPPSPGLDFDILIEDSINSETSTFKNDLIKGAADEGGDYFQFIEDIRAIQANTAKPTKAPSPDIFVYQGTANAKFEGTGLGLISIVVIVIVVAIVAFGCVFGTLIMRKRQRERSMFKTDEADYDEEDNEDDPLFFDVFKNRKSHDDKSHDPKNVYNKYGNDDHLSESTPETGPLSVHSRDNHLRPLVEDETYGASGRPARQSLLRANSSLHSRESLDNVPFTGLVPYGERNNASSQYNEGRDRGSSTRIKSNSEKPSALEYSGRSQMSRNSEGRRKQANGQNRSNGDAELHEGHVTEEQRLRRGNNSRWDGDVSVASASTSSTISSQGNPIPR